MKQEHKDLKIAMDSLKLELKKIKIRSLYKGIIDIFCSVYDLSLEGNYYKKLNNLLYELEKLTENDKIKELKEFLMDVYFYLQRAKNYYLRAFKTKIPYGIKAASRKN